MVYGRAFTVVEPKGTAHEKLKSIHKGCKQDIWTPFDSDAPSESDLCLVQNNLPHSASVAPPTYNIRHTTAPRHPEKPALLRVSNGANTAKIAAAKEHPETPPPAATANVEGTGASLPRRPS